MKKKFLNKLKTVFGTKSTGIIFMFGLFLFLLLPSLAFAQVDTGIAFGDRIGLGTTDPRVIAMNLVRIALGFLALIVVVLIIYAGFLWSSSGGDEQKIAKAKRTLTNAVIGLVIIMAAFGITTFLISRLLNITGRGSGRGTGPGATPTGIGAIGNCTIQNVYPEPGQRDVARNTSLVITFNQDVDPATVCSDGTCSGGAIIPQNVRIFQSNQGDGCPASCVDNFTNVNGYTTDNRTFVFTPVNYLGSPSEFIWYTVYLSNDITNDAGDPIFDTCFHKYFDWQFEVSNRLDLTPPQVVAGDLFPPPDDADDSQTTTAATAATGQITVDNIPDYYQAAQVTGVTNSVPGSIPASVTNYDANCSASGPLVALIDSGNASIALYQGSVILGAGIINNGRANFSYCNLELTLASGSYFDAGNCQSANCQWDISVTPVRPAHTLRVGSITYTFVSGAPTSNQIQVGGTTAATAQNIANRLGSHPAVTVSPAYTVGSDDINLRAIVGGTAGNNITLSGDPAIFTITAMSGGSNLSSVPIVNGQEDKPRNAVIQVNFNETMNPITISGDAADLSAFIRVVNATTSPVASGGACDSDADCISFNCDDTSGTCQGANTFLPGKWEISNGYRTVEFISDNQCGVNGCGENIYCLPANAHLRVIINASNLLACPADVDCNTKTPYINCNGGICQDAAGENMPTSTLPPNGAVDLAMNSLDGDRSAEAEGPSASNWDENTSAGNGDNFQFSFFISDQIDLNPPRIDNVSPPHASSSVSLIDPILIDFDKKMMSESFKPGSIRTFNGREYTSHRAINFWNFASLPIGYWIAKENIDDAPMDGVTDWTQAQIKHSILGDMVSYRVQVGSGVKDIYQNCYKPSSGPTCTASEGSPSCCPVSVNGAINPTTVPEGQNCP